MDSLILKDFPDYKATSSATAMRTGTNVHVHVHLHRGWIWIVVKVHTKQYSALSGITWSLFMARFSETTLRPLIMFPRQRGRNLEHVMPAFRKRDTFPRLSPESDFSQFQACCYGV